MRTIAKILLATAAMPLIFAGADGEVELLEPCANPSGLTVVSADGASMSVEAPEGPAYSGATTAQVIVDLAGQAVTDDSINLDVAMTWSTEVNDFDLVGYYDGAEAFDSQNINAVDGMGESGSVSAKHCGVIDLEVKNWSGVGALELDGITLDFTKGFTF